MPLTADCIANALLGLPVVGLIVRAVLAPAPEPRSFTLSSATPGNKIVKQLSFQGRYCIPSQVADRQVDDPVLLLDGLNDILGTHYSFHSIPALRPIMIYCIRKEYDLGMAYGLLRHWWFDISNFPSLLFHFEVLERQDSERRERVVYGGLFEERLTPPRRVWDLYSNRVLPFWAIQASWDESEIRHLRRSYEIQAVSHAWMPPALRHSMFTSINGFKWPVPIPKDINLDDLRIELLNLR
ncbi:hypothetical protein PENSPDRAFT_623695, partial [Peniophora sp. CONT]